MKNILLGDLTYFKVLLSLILLTLGFSYQIHAETKTNKKNIFTFGNEIIQGDSTNNNLLLFLDAKDSGAGSLLKLRDNFRKNLWKTKSDITGSDS